jgi:transcriptional regulator with XRE-family HTH domain
MDEKQAKKFGAYLRKARQELELSTHQLGEITDIPQPTIQRIETGEIKTPGADKLARIAEALDLDPAEVLQRAGQAVPTALLAPATYLRSKYRDLSDTRLNRLTREVAEVLRRHGIDPSGGPLPGEDEEPEPSRTKNPRTKKGGTP